MEPAREGIAEKTDLLHDLARRDGHRRSQVAGALLRHDDRAAMDWTRRRREVRVAVRFAAANSQRQSGGRLATTHLSAAGRTLRLHLDMYPSPAKQRCRQKRVCEERQR